MLSSHWHFRAHDSPTSHGDVNRSDFPTPPFYRLTSERFLYLTMSAPLMTAVVSRGCHKLAVMT